MEKESDCWETPQWLYDKLSQEFNFEIDLCATNDNKKTRHYGDYFKLRPLDELVSISSKEEYMKEFPARKVGDCFMNPPYSNPLPFIKKAYNDSKLCKIVVLIKADTSTKAWGVFWDYELNKPKPGCEVRFLPKRLKFERDGVPSKNCANFASAIIIMDRRKCGDL